MRSLLHPVGHLPPGVYWVRRALIVVLVVVLLVVLFRVMGGGPEPSASAGPVTSPTPAPSATLSVPSQSAGPPGTVSSTTATTATVRPSTRTAPKREDDGRCTAATTRVAVLPVARQVSAGRPLNVQVSLSTIRSDGCAATVDPNRLVVTVTSGKDRIWTTSHCLKAVPRATLALAAGKPSTTTVTWDGRRSAARCPANQSVARPGTYVVEASYAGRSSTEQAFQVV